MKKSLSLILAVVLAFGASSTAFAKHEQVVGPVASVGDAPTFANTEVYVTDKNGIVQTDADVLKTKNSNADALYIELKTDTEMKMADILKYKIRANWSVGKDLVEKISIVYKKGLATQITTNNDYAYFVEIKAKPGIMLSAADLQGELIVYKSSHNNAPPAQKFAMNFATVGEADVKFVNTLPSDLTKRETNNHTVWSTSDQAPNPQNPTNGYFAKIVDFDKTKMDETTITFAGVGEYEINVYEQDKLYLGFDRKANADIVAKHGYANMEFINFPGKPMFYRTGIMNLYAEDEATFVYEVKADGSIAAIKTTWDADYDAHKFAVRQFAGTYIVSDVELQLEAAVVTPAPGTETKPNPNTGR